MVSSVLAQGKQLAAVAGVCTSLPSMLEPSTCLLVGLASGAALLPLPAPEQTGSFSTSLGLKSLYLA